MGGSLDKKAPFIKMISGQRSERTHGDSQVDLWGKGIPHRRNIKCKGSEVGKC